VSRNEPHWRTDLGYPKSNRDAYFRAHKPHPPLAVQPLDTVCRTAYSLHAMGLGPTDPLWRQMGTVVAVHGEYAGVVWHDRPEDRAVRIHRSCLAFPHVPSRRLCE
jgi:hypothetical protein